MKMEVTMKMMKMLQIGVKMRMMSIMTVMKIMRR